MPARNRDASVRFQPLGAEPPADRPVACRAVLVGPGHNQPEPYEGYNGFVGWSGVTRLRSGRWLVTFTSGLWHATFPWTGEIARDPACRKQFEEWAAIGLPDLPAPRGGRAHVMHSDDAGQTWSAPRTLVDTERDDRHPTILELADSTLFCSWFASRYPRVTHAYSMLSHDGGETWTRPLHPGGEPQEGGFGNGSAIRLADGSVVWAISGGFGEAGVPAQVRIFRSRDNAATFEQIATIAGDHDLDEPTIAELPGGRLVLVARREGDMGWSDDGGETSMLLDDGTVYLVYLHTGGHRPEDARTESLFGLRVRVHDNAGGIDILPAPGSPAALGAAGSGADGGDAGDPELGDRM